MYTVRTLIYGLLIHFSAISQCRVVKKWAVCKLGNEPTVMHA